MLRHFAFLLTALALWVWPAAAHDIPADITVHGFVKPEGSTLRVLFRVPLRAITDIEYPRREGDFVDLTRIEPALRDAAALALINNVAFYEGDALLADPQILSARMSLESDKSFATFASALAHVTGPPLTADTTLLWEQGILDVLLQYPIKSEQSLFSIDAAFDRLALQVVTALHYLPPGGAERVFELDETAGLVRLDPRWHQAAARFVALGFIHILEGPDHLLFLLCLVIPFRRARTIIPIVTAFTVAHSITLIAAAFNYAPGALWFPPLIETLIAVSIIYMALENIVGAHIRWRWVITFVFGLVHGFGFSFGLQHTLQFAGAHLLTSLVSFNLGIELGQLLVLAAVVPVIELLFRHVVAERVGTIILSAIVAHTAWHWMGERFEVLQQFPWPTVTAADMANVLQWLMVPVALAAAVWVVTLVRQKNGARPSSVDQADTQPGE